MALSLQQNQLGLSQQQQAEKDDTQKMFEVVNALKAETQDEDEIIRLTKQKTLYKDNPTPKELIIPELEPPKKEKKEEAKKDDKKAEDKGDGA